MDQLSFEHSSSDEMLQQRRWNHFVSTCSVMRVADRPGDISILTHIFRSDYRTLVTLVSWTRHKAGWKKLFHKTFFTVKRSSRIGPNPFHSKFSKRPTFRSFFSGTSEAFCHKYLTFENTTGSSLVRVTHISLKPEGEATTRAFRRRLGRRWNLAPIDQKQEPGLETRFLCSSSSNNNSSNHANQNTLRRVLGHLSNRP